MKSSLIIRLCTRAIATLGLSAMACLPASSEVLNFTTPISPQDMVDSLGTGVDVTWSEVPEEIAVYNTDATIAFADKGFGHLRLRLAKDPASATWSYLDEQVQDALDNGLVPIIANQSHAFEDNPNATTQAEWVQWWEDTADHYRDYPYELMFDLIIEVAASSTLSDAPIDQLNEAYEQAVTAIRGTGGYNAERIIIFSAPKRSDATRMDELDIPTDGNGYLIGEFHEGYASGPSTDPTNPHYYWDGTPAEIQLMTSRADAAVAWSASTGIPLWEGAWMPGNYNKGDDYDLDRQIAFSEDFILVLNDRDIPHSINATWQFYDIFTDTWTYREPVVDAIIAMIGVTSEGPTTIFSEDFEAGNLNAFRVSGYSAYTDGVAAREGSLGVVLEKNTRLKMDVSTVGYSSATLTFSHKTDNLDEGESLKLQYSIDGEATYVTLKEMTSAQWFDKTVELPAAALGVSDLVIKLVLKANAVGETAYIDSVVLTGE